MGLQSSLWLVWLGHAILSNVVVALLLATVATIVGWRLRHPAMAHGLWLLVLIKLITPPILQLPIPVPAWMNFVPVSRSEVAVSRSEVAVERSEVAVSRSIHSVKIGADSSADRRYPDFVFTNSDVFNFKNEDSTIGKTDAFPSDSGQAYGWLDAVLVTLILLWFLVSITLMIRSMMRSIRFARVLEEEGREEPRASEIGQQMADASCVAKCPRIRLVSANLSPMLFGFGRWATIVIPDGLWQELSTPQKRAMLAHELSHFRRWDHWVRGLELIVGSLFFWLPLVRVARNQIERMEETCCDLNAVQALENDRRLYAESLLHVVDYISQRGGRMPSLASGMRPSITLEERLRSIMNDQATGRMSDKSRMFVGVFGLAALLIHPLASAAPSRGVAVDAIVVKNPSNDFANTPAHESIDHRSVDEVRIGMQRSTTGPLPEVPRGWWNDRQLDSVSRTLPRTAGQSYQLRFDPGVSIDVVFANGTVVRLAEPAPTAVVALHHASRLIVGNNEGDIRMWDVESQQSVSLIGHHDECVTSLCYHSSIGLLSGDASGLVLQWEIQSGAIQNSWSSHRGPIQSIRSDSGGQRIAIVFGDWRNETATSSFAMMSPSQWSVVSTMELPVPMATIDHSEGFWRAVDWDGNVYPLPFQFAFGAIAKSDVSAIAFCQDIPFPILNSVPITITTVLDESGSDL